MNHNYKIFKQLKDAGFPQGNNPEQLMKNVVIYLGKTANGFIGTIQKGNKKKEIPVFVDPSDHLNEKEIENIKERIIFLLNEWWVCGSEPSHKNCMDHIIPRLTVKDMIKK